MGLAEIVATLRADTSDFTAKMGAAKASVDDLSKSGASSFEQIGAVGKAALLGVSAAAVGVGIAAVDFGDKLELSQAQLQAALKASGISWASVSKSVADTGQSAQKYGDTQAEVDSALQKGVIATGSYSKAHQGLEVALEISAAKHVSLDTAMTAVDKTYAGSTRLLTQLGINLDVGSGKLSAIQTASEGVTKAQQALQTVQGEVASGQLTGASAAGALQAAHTTLADAEDKLHKNQSAVSDILDTVSQKMSGQASAAADTFQGRLDAARATGENLAAKIGLQLIPILEELVTDIENVVTWFDKHRAVAEALGIAIGTLVAGAIAVYIVNVGTNMVQATMRALTSLGLLDGGLATTGTDAEITAAKLDATGAAAGEAGMAGGMAEGEGAAVGLGGALGSMAVPIAVVTLGAVVLGDALSKGSKGFQDAANSAAGLSATTLPQLTLKMEAITKAQQQYSAALDDGGQKAAIARAALEGLGKQADTVRNQTDELNSNTTILSSNFGITKGQAQELADTLGINLTHSLSPAQVQAFRQQVQQAGLDMDNTGVKAQGMGANTVSAVSNMAANMRLQLNTGQWVTLGQDVDHGLASGITSSSGVVINTVQGVVQQVISAGRTGLHALSPSRVFMELGENVSQGLAIGIGNQAHLASNAVTSMVNSAVAAGGTSTPGAINSGGITPLTGLGSDAGTGGGSLTVNVNLDSLQLYQRTWPQLQTVLLQNKRAIVELGLA